MSKRIDWAREHNNWVLPSNLELEDYYNWPLSEYRGAYGVAVVVQHSPEFYNFWMNDDLLKERNWKVRELMKPMEELLLDTPLPTGGRVYLISDAVPTSRALWRLFGPLQRKWVAASCYVNIGFFPMSEKQDAPTERMVAASLTLYDYLCERHQSLSPMDHEPVELSRDQIRQLSLEMGLVVQNNMLFLPDKLRDLRNKAAVMARACLIGEDPVSAHHRFLDSGYSNFLMIEEPEFSHVKDTWITRQPHESTETMSGMGLTED